jgi:hypothetical protein
MYNIGTTNTQDLVLKGQIDKKFTKQKGPVSGKEMTSEFPLAGKREMDLFCP